MLTFMEDKMGGKIDTLTAACDKWRYGEQGFEQWHRSCADNLMEAVNAAGSQRDLL